ncbi:MAG: hypothetical protein KDD67_03495 [Ignavibacteriae bacterium]|nr:hypothetical protein [Ignavibacteriota bacterium]MCB9215095.1 hypothetical protein [Ignavibacteria bacterium]
MTPNEITIGADGFYHPASEEELIALVKKANQEGLLLRVRGSVHSVACAIYTDPCTEDENHVEKQTPPDTDNLNVMLDQYRTFRVVDQEQMLVEADAGINLGIDPSDPTHTSTLENSLLYQLWNDYGWTLSDLGGITHQTVSGFVSTGSSGGSLTYSINENLYAFRMIDGEGNVYEVSREDTSPDEFNAVALSMGLLGVISKITFKCIPTFNISGQEAITTYDEALVDLFGNGSAERPSFETFLTDVEYTRLVWWPQRGGERIIVWQCQRIAPQYGFRPVHYQEFGNYPEISEVAISIFYTIIGNLDDLSAAKPKLEESFDQLEGVLQLFLEKKEDLGEFGKIMADVLTKALEFGVDAAITLLIPLAPIIKALLPDIFPIVLGIFMPLDSTKKGMQKGEPQSFRDYGWHGLPMDGQASDTLVPTEFTEIWLPIGRTEEVMNILNNYFTEPKSKHEALRRTGTYAWELYGAGPTDIWMSPSYSNGNDEWKDGVFRIDPYWFAGNAGNPAEVFYPQLWDLLRQNNIPYRLHWGKYQPIVTEGDPDGWVAFFKSQYEKWDDFLAKRAEKDPNNIFLTDYWRNRFGLWDMPKPSPKS